MAHVDADRGVLSFELEFIEEHSVAQCVKVMVKEWEVGSERVQHERGVRLCSG